MSYFITERIFCCSSIILIKNRCFIFLWVSIKKRHNPLSLHTESLIEIFEEVQMKKEPPTIKRSPPIICVIFTFPFFFLQGWIQKQLRFSLFKTWHLVTNQIPKTIEFPSLFAMVVVMVMRMMMTTMTTMKMTVTIMTALEKNQNLRKLFYALTPQSASAGANMRKALSKGGNAINCRREDKTNTEWKNKTGRLDKLKIFPGYHITFAELSFLIA